MNKKVGKILVVDDNEDILFALKLLLKPHVELVHTTGNPSDIPELVKKGDYDVILLDMNFTKDAISGQEGFYWLEKILEIDPSSIVVFITAYGDAEKAVKAIKAGATDFILKPWQNEKLIATIASTVKLKQSQSEAQSLKERQKEISNVLDKPFHEFIGNSKAMLDVFATIQKVAKTDANVLILGENGTGKELVARALHRNSARLEEVFISVDLGSIAETLFESELFGHEKGSFTGATESRQGYFEVANGGTIFLDEVAELPLGTQVRLLRVLETGEFLRVGSSKVQKTNVRVIAATNVNLPKAIEDGKFREDLYYRLNTVPIQMPALRDRREDIPLLFRKFAVDFADKYRMPSITLDDEARHVLISYKWPGNVRQLKNVTEQISVIEQSRLISADILHRYLPDNQSSKLPALYKNAVDEQTFSSEREILYKILFDMRNDMNDLKKLVLDLLQSGRTDFEIHADNARLIQNLYKEVEPVVATPTNNVTFETKSFDSSHIQDTEEILEESLSLEEKEVELIRKALEKHKGKRKMAAQELGISERTLYRKIKEHNLD